VSVKDARTPWQVLELPPGSGRAELKAAYRRLARIYHPDHNGGDPEASTRFLEICDAYQQLTSRREQVEEAQEPASPSLHVSVSFLDAYRGGTISVDLPTTSTCNHCGGAGCKRCLDGKTVEKRSFSIEVPRGVADGTVLVAIEEKRAGYRQQLPVVADVAQSTMFARLKGHPDDLLLNLPISISEAALGAVVKLPTPSQIVHLKIPAGTQHGKIFRLPGHGMPKPSSAERGSLIIRVDVKIPTELSSGQRHALEELGKHDGNPRQGLLGR
jgi:DnaJ-class molecular chaperone